MLIATNLSKSFALPGEKGKIIQAVNNISFTLKSNENSAIVGESGSGKSTLAKMLSMVSKADAGQIFLDGEELTNRKKTELKSKRGKIQLVMQNAESSLDPHQTVRQILEEPMQLLLKLPKKARQESILKLLSQVQLEERILNRKPREFSGGQQKRICIARALATNPSHIIFDESFSGLDVTLKKQILTMLKDLQKTQAMSYLIITHDLDTALFMADDIHVMKQGMIIENVRKAKDFSDFKEPYSKELVKAVLFKRAALQK